MGRYKQRLAWTRDDVKITVRDGWLTLRQPGDNGQAAGGDLGRPGLWKHVAEPDGSTSRTFDVPLATLLARLDVAEVDGVDEERVVDESVQWALDTRQGQPVAEWETPTTRRLDEIVPKAALTLRAGANLGLVRFVTTPGRLAVRLPICRAAAELTEARRGWLERLLADAGRLRMVRLGLRCDGGPGTTIEAEIDLSGAPPCVLDSVVHVAVDALRAVFSLLATTTTFIAEANCPSVALDADPQETLFFNE